jgi:hypothetical protein
MVGSVFGLACGLLAVAGPVALVGLLLQKRRDEPAFL